MAELTLEGDSEMLLHTINSHAINSHALSSVAYEFASDVRQGLTLPGQKELPSKYLYDDVGSALFEVISRLPEYGLTRADERLLQRHAAEIVTPARSGSCSRTWQWQRQEGPLDTGGARPLAADVLLSG